MIETLTTEITLEIIRALGKFPTWPTDPIHAAAIVAEESGELQKAVLEACYEPDKKGPMNYTHVRAEAVQTAAMAIRFLLGMDSYQFRAGEQKSQSL